MTDSVDTPPQGSDREAMLARARALQAKRESGTRPTRSTHTASKIIAGGVATTASLLMVAAMAAADQQAAPATAPPVVERIVVIEVPVQNSGAPETVANAAQEPEITVIREVRTLPAPAQDATPAPAATQGS